MGILVFLQLTNNSAGEMETKTFCGSDGNPYGCEPAGNMLTVVGKVYGQNRRGAELRDSELGAEKGMRSQRALGLLTTKTEQTPGSDPVSDPVLTPVRTKYFQW